MYVGIGVGNTIFSVLRQSSMSSVVGVNDKLERQSRMGKKDRSGSGLVASGNVN